MSQIIPVMVKNCLLIELGIVIGYPTILIPRLSGNDPTEKITLGTEEISWIGEFCTIRCESRKEHINILVLFM